MKLINYLEKAKKQGSAIGQFNFSTMDQLRAIADVSLRTKAPVIAGMSMGEADFFGIEEAALIVSYYQNKKRIPIFLNLDHGRDLMVLKRAINAGYDMVHFDGSKLPIKENIAITKKVVSSAHKKGILVEGELGYIPGSSSYHKKNISIPDFEDIAIEDALSFAKKTGVDLLTIPVGSVHGVYSKSPKLKLKFLEEVSKKLSQSLVLHGGSGILPKEIKGAIKNGIRKINVNTELRVAWKNSLKRSISGNDYAPYLLLKDSKKAVAKKIEEKIKLFNL